MRTLFLAFLGCFVLAFSSYAAEGVVTDVLTKEKMATLSPDDVLALIIKGNKNFMQSKPTSRDIKAQLGKSDELGQAPMAIVLSCIDSRVPVEMIFDMGLGDIFVSRVAGNVISEDVLGSMEYATAHSTSKIVMILGHSSCGAVHAACHGESGGNMTDMLAKINTSITNTDDMVCGVRADDFEDLVVEQNVREMVSKAREGSEILRTLESEGKIKIVGAFFELSTGEVILLN
ncbi:MAG: carbonic anhydrase [Rikenellaceae bacterium]